MKQGFTKQIGRTLGLTLGLTFASASASMAAEPPPPATVGVYARHVGNKIVYYYRVTNKSPRDITAVSIGYNTVNDDDPVNDVWELVEIPSGWNVKFGIPATSSNTPTGWRATMTTPVDVPVPEEESKPHAITWEVINDKSPVLASGQTTTKMSIALDKTDINYLTGHALVTFSDGTPVTAAKGTQAPVAKSAATAVSSGPATTGTPEAVTKSPPLNISVPLEPLDTSPPTLVVTVTPNVIVSQDDKHIPVKVTFAKEDDFDKLPEIRLESIIANEPLEPDDVLDASYGLDDRFLRLRARRSGDIDRIYTVTYSATDASGNQTTASATVTVPAVAPPLDQGEKGKIEAR